MGCGLCGNSRVIGDSEDSLSPSPMLTEDKRQEDGQEDDVEEYETNKDALQQKRSSSSSKPKRQSSKAKDFWAAQSKQIAKEEKERKKRAKKPKQKQWKYQTAEKPKVEFDSLGTRETRVLSARDSKGNLRFEIPGVKTRSQNLENARAEEEKKLAEDVEMMRQKRENSMKVIDPSEFKAAQEAVSRALLKRPDDYELANNENTETLLQGMKDIFEKDGTDNRLTDEKEEKFIEILQSAGVLLSVPADSPKPEACVETKENPRHEVKNECLNLQPPSGSPQVEQAKPKVFKEINLNASQFLHTAKEKDKKVFVSTVCQLFEKKPTFEEVKFNYGALDEDNVVQIAQSLQKCENLQAVYFDSNDFGGKGLKALINLMDTHKDTLSTLSMQNLPVWQQISTELLGQFVEAIERSTALVKLGFDLKEFRHHEYKDRVSKALKRNCEKARRTRLKKKREKSKDFST